MSVKWEYSFGCLEWDKKTYRKDLLILPDRILCPWKREHGHHLSMDDLEEVLEADPRLLIIGTGEFGVMEVPDKVLEKLAKRGIDAEVMPTEKALQRFAEVLGKKEKKVAAALHLTC